MTTDLEPDATGAPEEVDDQRPAVLLLEPREGTPPVVEDSAGLAATVAAVAAGTGPVAVDAERASGYRYGQRAYLVQLRRAGSGTHLIDPLGCPDLRPLNAAIGAEEWVLHAASQDLPCLAELGLVPSVLFDTELAGRLLGYERVGLGAMVERVLGFQLEKGHSAADWSTRPLPASWLAYAALDVELLVELRDALDAELREQGKREWAAQEFEAVRLAPPPEPRAEPWRRVGGIHKVRGPRALAAVRELWEARDAIARRRDVAPGRVLPDSALISAVLAKPESEKALVALPIFSGPRMRRSSATWWQALQRAAALPDSALPRAAPRTNGPPTSGRWADRDPMAAARLVALRAALATAAEERSLPTENLLEPAVVRKIAWSPPEPTTPEVLEAALREHGARPWQVAITAELVAEALDSCVTGGNLT